MNNIYRQLLLGSPWLLPFPLVDYRIEWAMVFFMHRSPA